MRCQKEKVDAIWEAPSLELGTQQMPGTYCCDLTVGLTGGPDGDALPTSAVPEASAGLL